MINSTVFFSNLVFIEQISNHAMFVKSPSTGYVIIIVYVDDIVIVGSNVSGINETKKWLHSQLHKKDLGKLQNFLGIVMSRNKHGLLLVNKSMQRTWSWKLVVKT